MTIYLAHWFDCEDKMFRVAGIYRTKRAAWKRVIQLDGGTVQALTLGRAVRFTHEPPNFRCSLALNEKRDFMAPESERAKIYVTPEEQARLWLSHNGYRTLAGGSEYVSGPPLYEIMAQYHAWMEKTEPTLTCSEVVERLAKIADDYGTDMAMNGIDNHSAQSIAKGIRTYAPAILHSWRERRVQELEELLAKHSGCSHGNDSGSGGIDK